MKNYENLTKREQEVKELIIQGLTNKQIAQKLFISIHTAKSHVCNVLSKLCVHNRIEVALCEIKNLRKKLELLKQHSLTNSEVK